MATEKTSGKRIIYSFICFFSYFKISYLYFNKIHLLGEHCKAYKLKSEVFTYHTCWMCLKTRRGIVVRTPGSHYCGRAISRTLLLMTAEFVIDPRLFPPRFSSGSPCRSFFLIKLTFRIPITMRIPWEMWNFCSLILVCLLVAFTGWNKVFRWLWLWLQARKTFTEKENATRKKCEILGIFLTKLYS